MYTLCRHIAAFFAPTCNQKRRESRAFKVAVRDERDESARRWRTSKNQARVLRDLRSSREMVSRTSTRYRARSQRAAVARNWPGRSGSIAMMISFFCERARMADGLGLLEIGEFACLFERSL